MPGGFTGLMGRLMRGGGAAAARGGASGGKSLLRTLPAIAAGGGVAWTGADALRAAQEGTAGKQRWWDQTMGRNALADEVARGTEMKALPAGATSPGRSSALGRFIQRPWMTMTGGTTYDPGHDLLGPDSYAAQAKAMRGKVDATNAENKLQAAREAFRQAGIPFPLAAQQPAAPGGSGGGGGGLSGLLGLLPAMLGGQRPAPAAATGSSLPDLPAMWRSLTGGTPTATTAPAKRPPSAFHAGPHNFIGGNQSNRRGTPSLPWEEEAAAPDAEERLAARIRELVRTYNNAF